MTTDTLPDVTTAAELARELLGKWEAAFSVDLRSIVEDEHTSRHEKSRLLRARLLPALVARLEALARPEDLEPQLEGFDSRAFLSRLEGSRDQVPVCPNFFVTKADAATLLEKRDAEVLEYVTYLENRLFQMSTETDVTALATEMAASGIVGFLLEAARVAVAAYREGGITILKAIVAGIKGVSLTAVVAIVAVIALEILLWLASSNDKKFLGAVVNDTDLDLLVKGWRDESDTSNLYTETGNITLFPLEHTEDSLSSPAVQLRARIADGGSDAMSDLCAVGFFTAEKKFGFFGAEGAMVFSPLDTNVNPLVSFVLLYACPYSGDNGGNVFLQAGTVDGAKVFYERLYDSRAIGVINEAAGYRMQVSVNDPRGGVAAGIVGIVKL